MFKALLFSGLFLSAASLNFCSGQGAGQGDRPTSYEESAQNWPSLSARLACLPPSAALAAAHRGTSRGRGLAENALGSLEALIAGGVVLAEVDVARLASGEHILFHDGVWEDKSTGRGAVAASRLNQAQSYLLRDTEKGLTSETPPLLTDYLSRAKDRAYVEIDFKSSADYAQVIALIRTQKMQKDVVLIAYSKGQAAKLSRLAPEMALSVPVKKIGDIKAYRASGVKTKNLYAWIGGKNTAPGLAAQLTGAGVPVLNKGRRAPQDTDIWVSDYVLDTNLFEGVAGLSKAERAAYKNCLNAGFAQ